MLMSPKPAAAAADIRAAARFGVTLGVASAGALVGVFALFVASL